MGKTPLVAAAVTLGLLCAAAALADPVTASGPDGAPITSRIRRVTVYSDRARVTRTGQISLTGVRQRLLLPDLPAGIDDSSVSATSKTAKILSIEVETAYGKQTANKDAEALIEKGKVLDRKERGVQDELAALHKEESDLRGFQVKTHPDEKGHPIPVSPDPAAWQAWLSFVSDGLGTALPRIRAKEEEQRELGKQRQALNVELSKVRSYQSQATKVIALEVEGSAGPADLEVTYGIAGPAWRPSYDVRVASAKGSVEITTHGVISQQTGEDWKDVEVTLSTAAPAAGADLPDLLAWRLGDAQQFAYAADTGKVGKMDAGIAQTESRNEPQPVMAAADAAPSKRMDKSRGWFSKSSTSPAPAAPPAAVEEPEAAEQTTAKPAFDMPGVALGGQRLARNDRDENEADGDHERPPPPPPPPPSIRQINDNVWSLPAGHLFTFANDSAKAFYFSGDLLHCPSPMVSAGGFDYAFKPERKSTVLSDGRGHKVRLSTATFPAQLLDEVVAPLSTKAYLKATVTNNTRQPFLAGESFVFLDEDFAGRAFLNTVPSHATLDLSLGVDDSVKVERRVEQSAVTSGLFTKKDKTVYTVSVEVKSFKNRPIEVLLRDDVPTTWQKDDITVEEVSLSPTPLDEKSGSVPSKGLYAWRLSLPAGGKQLVKISYAVEHPRDFDMVETRSQP